MLRIELGEVYFLLNVLTWVEEEDTEFTVVFQRLNLLLIVSVLAIVQSLHINLGCHHSIHGLLLHELSLLRRVIGELAHHAWHLMMGQLLAGLGCRGGGEGLIGLIGLPLLLLRQECLQLVILGTDEWVLEASVGHAVLLRGLLLVLVGHVPL